MLKEAGEDGRNLKPVGLLFGSGIFGYMQELRFIRPFMRRRQGCSCASTSDSNRLVEVNLVPTEAGLANAESYKGLLLALLHARLIYSTRSSALPTHTPTTHRVGDATRTPASPPLSIALRSSSLCHRPSSSSSSPSSNRSICT